MPIPLINKFILALTVLTTLTACAQKSALPLSTPIPAVSEAQLIAHTKTITTTFYPRDYQHLDNLNKTADYIKQQLQAYTPRISEQPFEVEGVTYRNIIARFGPDQGELLVIGAHYDACGLTHGADDNASGVAGLLELARLLHEHPPKGPVELVAYSLEEPPFFATENMGSAYHARQLKQANTPVKLMLSLEMIGYFKDDADSQSYPLGLLKAFYGDKGDFIGVIGHFTNHSTAKQVKNLMKSASDLPVYSLNAPSITPGIDYSDHRNYWNQGFDALMITDTSFYRNPYYHIDQADSWDSLDYQRMAKVVQGVYLVVQQLSDTSASPSP